MAFKNTITQELDIQIVVNTINVYFINHRYPVSYKTVANRVNISPKQSQYILNTYFQNYKVRSNLNKMSKKIYYVKSA